MTNNFDIAIIGAGPSGCACALALEGSGLNVVLIEKEVFPRDKICGDAIPGPAFKAMDKINIQWGNALRELSRKTYIQTSQLFVPNGKSLSVNWVTYSFNSERLHFDAFLAQIVKSETHTTLLENKRLNQIERHKNGVSLHFDDKTVINASIVMGCDGANSIVNRQLSNFDLKNPQICAAAVRGYYKGVKGLKNGVNEFHFFKELLPGYFWIFPLENGSANVGFGILPNKKSKNEKPLKLRETLQFIISKQPNITSRFQNAELLDTIKGFALPMGIHKQTISGERYMLCGDAAALIDPLQGHGIDKAMWSGYFAAQQAILCFKNQDFSAQIMSQYDKMVYKKVGFELKKNTYLMRYLNYFPWCVNLLAWMGQNQKLVNWLTKVFKI